MLNKFDTHRQIANLHVYNYFVQHKENDICIKVYAGFGLSGDFSVPLCADNLYEYELLSLEIAYDGALMNPSSFDKNDLDKLYPYRNGHTCQYMLVPIALVEEFIKKMKGVRTDDKKQEEEVYGGKCCVCGSYDDYAPMKNGKFHCYKHFV